MYAQYLLLSPKWETLYMFSGHDMNGNFIPSPHYIIKENGGPGCILVCYKHYSRSYFYDKFYKRYVTVSRVDNYDFEKGRNSLEMRTLPKTSHEYKKGFSILRTWRFLEGYAV